MVQYRRHLRRRGRGERPACGVTNGRFFTTVPGEVTCGGCQRTLYMADAELAYVQKQGKRRRERRKE